MSENYFTTSNTQIRSPTVPAKSLAGVAEDFRVIQPPSRPSVIPSPELSPSELTDQVAALRAELRDGRILQAKQRSQIDLQSAHIAALTCNYREVKRERQELRTKLNHERGVVVAVEKRLGVAVKNHGEAQDKCARTMVECEKLRILNEQLALQNEELGVSRHEAATDFDLRIKEIQNTFKDKLEENEQRLVQERLGETQALRKDLDARDAKIKKLEHDLNRQCEINAMFTIDYDRETNFIKRLSMPLSVPMTSVSGRSSLAVPSHSYQPGSRRPLTDIESNQDLTSRKRLRTTSEHDEKSGHALSKASRLSPLGKVSRKETPVGPNRDGIERRPGPSHHKNSVNKVQQLPTPDSSFRMSGRRF
ncbi:hypothetical protein CTheo_7904 [Ceratobasidium theobromae]|uniref:Uncharacterized protein n=1 Tax=Ceratobasidium theobromae TaxID=1582974 RepID=A0A5N5QA90_9AGAM|nr:hypothetical protein CTheo_7904 [Ceratobasidium theobromae]